MKIINKLFFICFIILEMRFLKKIELDDLKDTYSPEQFINITLPSNIVDLHTFKLYYTGTCSHYIYTSTNKYMKRFFPRLSASIIDELIISIDGEIKQYTREYGYLFNILNDIKNENDDIDGTSFDTIQGHKIDANGVIQNTCKIQAIADASYTTDDFFISKWLGFLNEGNQFFDCRNKNVKITIKLAPSSILYNGINTVDATYAITNTYDKSYYLSNVYASIDVVDKADVSNDFTFKDYITVKGMDCISNKSSIVSFTIEKPILWVLGTFTNPNRFTDGELILQHANSSVGTYGGMLKDVVTVTNLNAKIPISLCYSYDVSKNQKDPYLLNNSIYFDRNGVNVKSCKWRVNNFDMTPPMSMVACYNETKQVFNSDYKKVISIPSFESNFFCNAINIEDYTSDFKRIEWEVLNDPMKFDVGGTPYIFSCVLSKI